MLGGGAGTILDMIMRLRANKNLLRRRSLFKKNKSFFDEDKDDFKTPHTELIFKTISEEELENIKRQNAAHRRSSRRKMIFVYLVFAPFAFYAAVMAYQAIQKDYSLEKKIEQEKVEQEAKVREENYEYFLKDGDKWLYQNHYRNAIYQYKKALEVMPSDFTAKFHLATAYAYSCQVDQIFCYEAEKLIRELMKIYPESKELQNLLKIINGK